MSYLHQNIPGSPVNSYAGQAMPYSMIGRT